MHSADKHPHPPIGQKTFVEPFAIYQNNIMSSRGLSGIILLVGLVIASIGNEDLV